MWTSWIEWISCCSRALPSAVSVSMSPTMERISVCTSWRMWSQSSRIPAGEREDDSLHLSWYSPVSSLRVTPDHPSQVHDVHGRHVPHALLCIHVTSTPGTRSVSMSRPPPGLALYPCRLSPIQGSDGICDERESGHGDRVCSRQRQRRIDDSSATCYLPATCVSSLAHETRRPLSRSLAHIVERKSFMAVNRLLVQSRASMQIYKHLDASKRMSKRSRGTSGLMLDSSADARDSTNF